MRMKAAVLNGVGERLNVEEVELDDPRAGEVRIRMVATGMCRSDIKMLTGDSQFDTYPVVLGHEGAGVVDALGEGVTRVALGDHVILTTLPSCGRCRWCHTGEPYMCDNLALIGSGKLLDGTSRLHRLGEAAGTGAGLHHFFFVSTYAQYAVVPEVSVVQVPHDVPLERMCLLGCGFTTGFGAVTNSAHVRPGETVMIIGCGGLGLSGIQAARLRTASKIIAVDIHPEKLALARKFGATHTILNTHDPDAVVGEIMDITWGLGVDHSFEFVGFTQSPETIDLAFRATRKGGSCYIAGVGRPDEETLPISPWHLVHYRVRVQGVLMGDVQFQVDIPRYVELYRDGRIDLDNMVTEEFPLERINDMVDNILAQNRVARQVIRFD